MKYIKMLGLAAVSAMALMAFGAGSASATTLEVATVTQNSSVTLSATLASGTSAILETTSGDFQDTCTSSTVGGKTESPFTGTTVSGKVTTLTFSNCTHGTRVKSNGSLSVEHIKNTTNGTVRSTGASVEVDSTTFGATLTCTTNNTHLGTLTGSGHAHATMHINAVVNCGFFAPTARWKGTYTVTSPTGLGVSA
jgi:hypothetical protein